MYKINFKEPIHIHFIGIGGISMSGLAEILSEEHFTVSGSDAKESDLTRHLEHLGIKVYYGQTAANITDDIDLVVYTAAIHEDNPEFACAREKGIPMMPRAELLGQIMDNYRNSIAVAGTHGKTTTTSMISQILLAAKCDPTITVGGILKALDGNLRVGKSDFFLSEACEYTNSFLHFYPKYSIILNIEAEHLDFFKDIQDIRHSFHQFASNTREDGAIIINGDIPDYTEITAGLKPQVITFGLGDSCMFHPADITFDEKACASFTAMKGQEPLMKVTLHVPGMHNVSNACSAAAVGFAAGMEAAQVAAALSGAKPEAGRQEVIEAPGGFTVINDAYNANPDSMRASLSTFAALDVAGTRIAVLGDMGELGSFAPQLHEEVGAFAAECGLDRLVCVGQLAQGIAAGAQKAGMPADRIAMVADGAAALADVREHVASGSAVLVKASHFMALEKVVEGLVE